MTCNRQQACFGPAGRDGESSKKADAVFVLQLGAALDLVFCNELVNRKKLTVSCCWSRCENQSGHRSGKQGTSVELAKPMTMAQVEPFHVSGADGAGLQVEDFHGQAGAEQKDCGHQC